MPAAAVVPAISAAGSIYGGISQGKAQKSLTNTASQETGDAMKLINNFLSTAGPTVSSLVSSLQNWNGLKPQEMNQLTTSAEDQGMSNIATAQSRGAYGANQNAVMQNALQQSNQQAGANAVQIGSNAATQELSALQSIPSALNVLSPGNTGANTLAGLSENTLNDALSMGNGSSSIASGLGGLYSSLSGNQSGKTGKSSGANTIANPSTINWGTSLPNGGDPAVNALPPPAFGSFSQTYSGNGPQQ